MTKGRRDDEEEVTPTQPDPDEVRAHWTTERRAGARPREHTREPEPPAGSPTPPA